MLNFVLGPSGSGKTKWLIDKANEEYEKFRIKQDEQYISSMDEMYKKYME